MNFVLENGHGYILRFNDFTILRFNILIFYVFRLSSTRKQLFADSLGDGVQPCTRTTGEDDSFHKFTMFYAPFLKYQATKRRAVTTRQNSNKLGSALAAPKVHIIVYSLECRVVGAKLKSLELSQSSFTSGPS